MDRGTQAKSGKESILLHASWPTRIVYALALVGFLPSAILGSSGWISLALGGGGVRTTFLIVGSLFVFRAYQVMRYAAALDARPPNKLGWLLRKLGWVAMLVSAMSSVGVFFVKPITLLLFKSAGDSGVGYFVVGLTLVMLGGNGWLGCAVFEVSRRCGRVLPDGASSHWSRRKQDFAVLGVLLATAVAVPYLVRETVEQPCGEGNLAACASTTQSEVLRVIGLPYGEAVLLDSNVDEIEMRSTGGRKWSLIETPLNSLRGAGHPAAESSPSDVRVHVEAKQDDQAVVLELAISQGAERTAHFVTRYPKGAVLEKMADGRTRLIVDLPANAKPGMRSMTRDPRTGGSVTYDQLFILIRSGLASETEAREWAMRVQRPAVLVNPSAATPSFKASPDVLVDPACKGRLEISGAQETSFQRNLGSPMRAVTFLAADSSRAHALMGSVDSVVCREGEIWIVSYPDRRPEVRIRRYGSDGTLVRFVDTTVPPTKLGQLEFDQIDANSVREENGRIRFERVITLVSGANLSEKKREVFDVTL